MEILLHSMAAHKVKEGVSSKTTEHRQIIETIKSLVLAKCKSKKKFQKIFSMVDRDSSGTLNVQEFFVLIQQCVKGHDNVAKKLTKQIFDIMWDDFCDKEGGVDCKAASEWIFS
jgi:Ca2+-binding EF-hand superfamily protein